MIFRQNEKAKEIYFAKILLKHNVALTCTLDIQQVCAGLQHGHAVWTCSMDMQLDMQHGHAVWTRSTNMHAARTPPWTYIIGMQHGNAAGPYSMNLQHGHAVWTCNKDKQHGHTYGQAAGKCSNHLQQLHAVRRCSIDIHNG
jgi:hypothetical protein